MPWSASARRLPSASEDANLSSVTARLEASRLQDRQHGSSRSRAHHGRDELRRAMFGGTGNVTGTAGWQFELSEAIQSETRRKLNTAGPIPQSWRRVSSQLPDSNAKRRRTIPGQLSSARNVGSVQDGARPTSLKHECLLLVLQDLQEDDYFLDILFLLPPHLKTALLAVAPSVAPLSDRLLSALLVDKDSQAEESQRENWDTEEADTWLSVSPAVPELIELDISFGTVSLSMLRTLLVKRALTASRIDTCRMPTLQSLSISHIELVLDTRLLSILGCTRLTDLRAAGLSCALFSPLVSMAKSLPHLKTLDLSQSSWLTYEAIEEVSWDNRWRDLETLTLGGCSLLQSQGSHHDPEARVTGPPVVMQVTALVRQKGRRRWLDVIA